MSEFIPRFLIHVLHDGFHRLRHSGLKAKITKIRASLFAQRPGKATVSEPKPDAQAGNHAHRPLLGRFDQRLWVATTRETSS